MLSTMQTIALMLAVIMFTVGVAMIVHQKQFRKLYKDMISSRPFMFVMVLINLIFAIAILGQQYNITADMVSVVVILGWMALLKGVLILWVPDFTTSVGKRLVVKASDSEMKLIGVFEIVLGVGLAYLAIGFM